MKNRLIIYFIGLLIIAAIFRGWLINSQIIGGDWPYFFRETLLDFSLSPKSWKPISGNGLGGQNLLFPIDSYLSFIVALFVNTLRIPWELTYKIFFFGLFLVLSVFSSSYLLKKCFINISNRQRLLGSIIYVTNTYILMLVGGGQMGVAIAYAIAPLVLYSFINIVESIKLKYSVLSGLLLGTLVLFDLRITYIILSALTLYALFSAKQIFIGKKLKEKIVNIFYVFIIPFIISLLINAFWMLPLLVLQKNPAQSLEAAFISIDAVKFFSFAKLENTISLLHPNWPENIFGKIYFMRDEFLLLPILAFSSLFFINSREKKEKNYIIYFALVGLIGAFLAKGANDPFGNIYIWLFEHVPGFNMFRDSTKWYTLVTISYSILIPYTISRIYDVLRSQSKIVPQAMHLLRGKIINIQNFFVLLVISYLLFLIHPALFGQLGGTFKTTSVPREYFQLKEFLHSKPQFFRTLWVPTYQHFGYYSNKHISVPAGELLKNSKKISIIKQLPKPEARQILQEAGVKYVIVPFDSESEIFLSDRKYDDKKYNEIVLQLDKISWLKKINTFGKIIVYEVPDPKDHFWSPQNNIRLRHQYINPTKYKVSVQNANKGDVLVFAENYDPGWHIQSSKFKVQSSKFNGKFNSFILPKNGSYNLDVYYEPQNFVNVGLAISVLALFVTLSGLAYWRYKKT